MLSLEVGGSARAMKPAHHMASPSKEETDRLRAMSSGLSLALGTDSSFPIHSSRPSFPVQLDLLPRSPAVAQQPPVSCSSQASRLPQLHPLFAAAAGRMSPSTAAAAASPNDCLEIVQVAASETHSSSRNGSPGPRGLDMNEIPPCDAAGTAATAAASSPRSSMSPPFPLDMRSGSPSIKRERERPTTTTAGLDQDADRTCEVSSRGSDEEDGAPRKKLRLSKEQSALLEESFKEHSTLNPKQKNALAKQLNLRPRQVEVWFQNRRARTKLKQTEIDCELLKRCCETLTEENRRLQKEVQELRAIKVPPPCVISQDFYMPLPAATLTMCPSCERLATVDGRSAAGSLPFAAAAAAKAQSSFHHFSPSHQAQHQQHQPPQQAAAACHS